MTIILGITDSVNKCDNGKGCFHREHRRTVAIEKDSGDVNYYCVTCAKRDHGMEIATKDVATIMAVADDVYENPRKTEEFSLNNFDQFVEEIASHGYAGVIKYTLGPKDLMGEQSWHWNGMKIRAGYFSQ